MSELWIMLSAIPPLGIFCCQFLTLILSHYKFSKMNRWFCRPKKFTLKAYKRYWFTCNDLQLRLYKSQVDGMGGSPPVYKINLRGCEVTPDVNLTQNKFGMKLEVPGPEGMSEMWIRCDTVCVRCCLCD